MHLPPLRHLAAASLLACAAMPAHAQFTTGIMNANRMFHQASPLADGRILLTGGSSSPGVAPFASTESYDPATGVFSPRAPMLTARREHAAITLLDGRVLVAGGTTPNSTFSSSAEIYDPATGLWTATGQMNTAYFRTLARLLPDGRAMIADRGGSGGHHAEIYDPASGSFSKSGNMVETSSWHGMVVLADGRVLKVGGFANNAYSRNAEIWDPATNMWSATGPMAEARQDIQPVLLPDGKVLVAGGRSSMRLRSTEIYDPATGTFSAGPEMPIEFAPDSATLLANGDFIFTDAYARQLLRYRPGTGSWNIAGPKRTATRATTVSRLPDDGLLFAGGAALNDANAYATVWDRACTGQQNTVPGATQAAPADGGTVSYVVRAAPGCRFEAATLPAWLSLDGPNPLPMPEAGSTAVTFAAAANMTGAARSASFYLANEWVTVTQAASGTCPWAPTVSPNVTTVRYQGGSGTASVSAPAACPWTISSLPGFVTLTSAASGTGNGSFAYAVPANPGTASRSGSGQLSALGQSTSFTFTQDGPPQCPHAPSVALSSTSFPAAGGTISASVTAAPTCSWSVSTLPAWVRVAGSSSGTGSGNFVLSALSNDGASRNGSGAVTGPGVSSTFNLSQAAGPCASWSITPRNANFAAEGTAGSFAVTAPASCNWSLAAVPSWISLSGASSGSGNATINYVVAANTGATRSATAVLSGSGPTLSLSLSQAGVAGPGCSAAIGSGVAVNGFLQASGCPTGARGSSYYTDRYTFSSAPGRLVTITLTSSAFDTYLYLRNPAGTVITSDDDSGGGTNSRISFTLPAGTAGNYTIEVTSYGTYRSGAYTLSLAQ